MRLVHKLFLVMTAVSIVSIMLFAATAHWQFRRSFELYLAESRHQHLEQLAARVQDHYREYGSLQALGESSRLWRRLVRAPLAPTEADRRPPPAPGNDKRLAETSSAESRGLYPGNITGHLPGHLPGHPAGDLRGPPRSRRGISLYDADGMLVAGRLPFAATADKRAVSVDGVVRGWVGAPAIRLPAAGRDQRFASRQLKILLMGGAVASVLSLLVATFFARRIAGPVTHIGRAARQLAGGDLESRVSVDGSNEIRQLGDDFNILARTLRRNESARRRYFADISHELRTPLAILRGEIDAVRDGVRPNDARLIDSVDQEVRRLEHLIDDLYQLARADIGSLEYQFVPCQPADVVRDTVVRFANRFEQRQLWCSEDLDDTLSLNADPARISQLLENLLENCCRYVAAPGRVRVTLAREHGNAVLRIEDSGPVPPSTDLALLFDPLHRGDPSRARDSGGAGLGLAICRAIATAHGGEIRAETSPLDGLAVIVNLPLDGNA